MTKFEIQCENRKYIFGVDKVKYIIGSNYEAKYDIIRTLKKTFNKVDESDYASEKSFITRIKLNDEVIKLRETKLIEINTSIDLSDELKFKSKSIYVSLLHALFEEIEYNELVNTINVFKKDLSDYMNDRLALVNSKLKLKVYFEDLIIKNIVKSLKSKLVIDENECNQFDLNYNDLIIYQLEMAEEIIINNNSFDYIIIVEIPKLTNEIINKLQAIKEINMKILVISNDIKISCLDVDLSNIYSINKQKVDFFNEIEVFEKITMNLSNITTLTETFLLLESYLLNDSDEKLIELERII